MFGWRNQQGRRTASLTVALVAVPALALVLAGVALAVGGATKRKKVSRDPYHNTSSFHATEVEPDTFSFGKRIVAAFQAGRFAAGGASNIGWATSSDAGVRWRHGFLPGTTAFSRPKGKFGRESDPSVAYDAAHKTWLISGLALTAHDSPVAVIVNRSTDGGLRWSSPATVDAVTGTESFDKDWIVCDDKATSAHYGHCYEEWDDAGNRSQLHMAYSRDGGRKWSQSRVPAAGVIGGQPVVQPNGHVVMPIDNANMSAVESFVSTNGGVSYTGPTAVATVLSHADGGDMRSPALPSAAVDGAGRVYVAWSDCRFRSGCSANDIVFSSSSDGTHWSAVKRIPIDATDSGIDHFLPGLGVAADTSGRRAKLALTYYYYPHTSCSVSTCRLYVGFVSSSDGGRKWSAPIRLAGPTKIDELPLTTQGYMVGDYLSTSLLTGFSGDPALSVFAVGLPVAGKTCTLGQVTSCDEPMEAPSKALRIAGSASRLALAGPVFSRRSTRSTSARVTYH